MPSLPEQFQRHEPYFIDLSSELATLRTAKKTTICTDDQGIQGVRFAIQSEGGAYGDARAMDIAVALDSGITSFEPTDFIDETRTIAAFTGGTTHEHCAAMALPRSLDQWKLDHSDALLAGSEILAPGLVTSRDIDVALERVEYRSKANQIYLQRDEIERRLAEIDEDGNSVPHHKLHHTLGHKGLVLISNDIKDSYYDTARAYEENHAAYGFTLHALGDKALKLSSVFPLVNSDAFIKARVMNMVAVAANLPNSAKGPGGKGIDLAYRGENFAIAA